MERDRLLAVVIAAALGGLIWLGQSPVKDDGCKDGACPVPKPKPAPTPSPKPAPAPRKPWGESARAPVGAKVGGEEMDGKRLRNPLPGALHRKNISARGLGCCVFRSIDHAAMWQSVPALQDFPEWMVKKGIEGGGYPSKVDKLIDQICKDRGVPKPSYLQIEGVDLEILKRACQSGRIVCVTYSRSPTGRYGGSRIAHMVNLVHADDDWFVVLDNNYIGDRNYEWMTPAEFKKAYADGEAGWSVILLNPGPPLPPYNQSSKELF